MFSVDFVAIIKGYSLGMLYENLFSKQLTISERFMPISKIILRKCHQDNKYQSKYKFKLKTFAPPG